MRSLTEMTPDELEEARRAAETLIRFRAYLPPDAILVMLAGRFRDDVREVLGMEPEPRAYRGQERNSLDEVTSAELNSVAAATGILLDRFTPFMDDPELVTLLLQLRERLNGQKAERAQLQASIGAT
jgi:hypothetical protein